MSAKSATARIIELQPAEIPAIETTTPIRGELLAFGEDGSLTVRAQNREFPCDWLETQANSTLRLEPGDRLLVLPPDESGRGLVLGRIGTYKQPQPQTHVCIEAGETLTLRCGEASVELRKEGKAMVKGEDVLLRAKGTQRIRAGSVAIN